MGCGGFFFFFFFFFPLSAAAVCDFCKKRESELYQKEVCVTVPYLLYLTYCVCFNVCVLTCACVRVSRSHTCRRWRSASLVCGLSASAVRAPCMRMCSAPGRLPQPPPHSLYAKMDVRAKGATEQSKRVHSALNTRVWGQVYMLWSRQSTVFPEKL